MLLFTLQSVDDEQETSYNKKQIRSVRASEHKRIRHMQLLLLMLLFVVVLFDLSVGICKNLFIYEENITRMNNEEHTAISTTKNKTKTEKRKQNKEMEKRRENRRKKMMLMIIMMMIIIIRNRE